MKRIAILHTPFCPLSGDRRTLHYHCDYIDVQHSGEFQYQEAMVFVETHGMSIPILDTQGRLQAMPEVQWQAELLLPSTYILRPGQSLILPPLYHYQRR